jgi:hypothetical protein
MLCINTEKAPKRAFFIENILSLFLGDKKNLKNPVTLPLLSRPIPEIAQKKLQ